SPAPNRGRDDAIPFRRDRSDHGHRIAGRQPHVLVLIRLGEIDLHRKGAALERRDDHRVGRDPQHAPIDTDREVLRAAAAGEQRKNAHGQDARRTASQPAARGPFHRCASPGLWTPCSDRSFRRGASCNASALACVTTPVQTESLGTSGASSPRRPRVRVLVLVAHALVAVTLVVSAVRAFGQPTAQTIDPKHAPAATIAPIPIPEVAQRAEQMAVLLQSAEQPGEPRMEDADAQLAAAGEWIRAHLVPTAEALTSSPSADALTYLTDSWQLMRSRLTVLDDALTRRATLIQQRVDELDVMHATWTATRGNARQAGAPPTVLQRIDDTMAAIAAARRNADARLARVLGLQDRTVKNIARCDDVLGRIVQVSHRPQAALLSRDALPIWSREARTLMTSSLGQRLREAVVDRIELIRDFVASQLARVPVQIALLVIVFVLARRARRAAPRADEGPDAAAAAQVFELPFSS